MIGSVVAVADQTQDADPVVDPAAQASSIQPEDLTAGRLVKHYELIRKLGEGGMGTVFLARDVRLGRLVAIKFLLDHGGTAAQRFLVEARITAQCTHENIVIIHDVDEIGEYPYMVLEYIEGRTLRAAMAERAYDTPAAAVDLMLPVTRALSRAHEMGIVHRDLKPENILLADDGRVKVVDFGIAKHVSLALALTLPETRALYQDSALLTQDGGMVGTLPYMSPEQWLGDSIDARTDIWAAGIILFELLARTHPLDPTSVPALSQVMDLDIRMPSIREKRPDLGAVADVIDQCLEKRKDNRIQSAKALEEELERVVAAHRNLEDAIDESPFAGLSAFQEADAARFFGRDQDVAAVVARLRSQQLIMITGASGAGKSSLVRAGVIPALKRQGRDVEAFLVRPGRRPLTALANLLMTVDSARSKATAKTLKAQPGYLGARLRARCQQRGANHRILLFVDQLEELYTLGADARERAAFCACIEGVADDASSPLRVVMTMRGDFLDRLAEERRFSAEVTRGLVLLPPMSRQGLRDALAKPVEAAQYRFEDDALINEMLDGLAGTRSPLPVLQFTATRLWEARDQEKRVLTRQTYRALGGVAGALSTHADAVFSGMSLPKQQLARAILTRLVTPERTRAIVHLDELSALLEDQDDAVAAVIHDLAEARLLSIEGKTVELTHESLIERWAKLRQWIDSDEQDAQFLAELRTAALQWQKNGEVDGLLWREETAQNAGAWYARRGATGLATREQRFIEAVVRLSEKTKQRRKQTGAALIASLLFIVVVILVLLVRANREANRADVQKLEAERNAAQARNATRMAVANERQHDPTTVLALLREVEPGPMPHGWAELAGWARRAGVAREVLNHPEWVTMAAFSPDGRRIVTGSTDKAVRVWNADGTGVWGAARHRRPEAPNVQPGQPLVLQGHDDMVYSVSFSPDGQRIASAGGDKAIRVWNADGAGNPIVLRGHDDVVFSVAFHPDGQRIISGSGDKTVRLWNANGSDQPRLLHAGEDSVYVVGFDPTGQRLVCTSGRTVRVWNVDGSGQPVVLSGHEDRVWQALFSPDGQRIVSASVDKTVRVWNADGSGQPLVLRGHEHDVGAASFSPDGRRIVSSSEDKTVRVWNADGSGQPLVLRGHEEGVNAASFSPDGQRIVSASVDKTVRVWNIEDSERMLRLRGHEDRVTTAAFSPDGQRIVSGSVDKTVRVWRADGSGQRLVLRGHDDTITSTAFSGDGQRIASGSNDRTVRVWNGDGSGRPLVLEGHTDAVASVAFRHDGQRIASGSWDNTIRVWNADGAGQPVVLKGHELPVYSVAFSLDGRRIVSTSGDRSVRIWNADGSGQPVVLEGHSYVVLAAAFSPDGRHIATASVDKTVRIWDPEGKGSPLVLEGHEGAVSGVAFSPDGKRIVSSSFDSTVRIWNVDGTGKPIVLSALSGQLNSVSWSPDGKRVIAASDDHTVIVWSDLDTLQDADDPRLWRATTYCMPLEVRQRLLFFPEEQSRADLDRCQRRVADARSGP